MQNINDLISVSSGEDVREGSVQDQFQKKQHEIKIKDMERQTKEMAISLGVSYVSLFGFPISPEALVLIPEKIARDLQVVCFFYNGEQVRIATRNPKNKDISKILEDINKKLHVSGKIYMVSVHSMEYALDFYASLPKIRKVIRGVEITEKDLKRFSNEISDFKALNNKINKVTITDVVTLIIVTAMKIDSSDIHIEARESDIVVRFRMDGVLQQAAIINKDKWKKIISRMKLLAKVKMNINDKPQDGRYTIFLVDDKIEVRSSFLPTAYGESVVMRLLKSSSIGLSFDELGLRKDTYKILNEEIQKPNGLILTTGPTGSGKTTTLYAILRQLNTVDVKIITLENPIEYKLKGISQSQVDSKRGYTFAKGLRSILRQDPDIVMVGEIRDLETAEIAIQASLTGHLVFTTLHTNDSSGVVPRLIDMGVKPFFLTPAINAVVGQRLIRKVCQHCKEPHELNEEESEKLNKILAVISPKAEVNIPNVLPPLYKAGKGCDKCGGIGYKGRIGVYEIFKMTDDIKELVFKNAPSFKILQQAIENGMVTMLQDGILKCLNGVSTLDEVYRVIGKFDYVDTLFDIVAAGSVGRGIKIVPEILDEVTKLVTDLKNVGKAISKQPPKEMFAYIMAAALKSDSGDLHIDPIESGVKIRFRIDGIMYDIVSMGKEHYIPLLSKVKTLCGFPLNIKKPTYDGRFGIILKNGKRDCRVSIISGAYGETVVIRILADEANDLQMVNLGIRDVALKTIKRLLTKTKGIIITTGPTGSGKTTTLYSVLREINKPDIKIITIEDPIESRIDGVMQTQIDVDNGYTFKAAIRSLMRQNPDIIMVGEIRDNETAETAIMAAQTGHLVLSTIHSNNAAGAIARFVGLGVTRQALASSMECSIGQRLVRRVCKYCKKEYKLPAEIRKEVEEILESINKSIGVKIPKELKFYKGEGCERCNGLGYKGRLGLYEVIEMIPEIQKVIQSPGATSYDIEQAAMKYGTITMAQDGILKALAGDTTVEEVFRVTK
ncbi:type II/IV secretion system protein [Candidatus Parcubacteria bacterium]|nr:type II/IV secretion system protein [Candidatus Parcubacteria bacterium]